MNKIFTLILAFGLSAQVVALEAFVSICEYKENDGVFGRGSVLGIMYPQKYQSSTYYLFELQNGVYVEHGSGAAGSDYFQTAQTESIEQGEYYLKRAMLLLEYLNSNTFNLVEIPENYSKLALNTNVPCNISLK